jgi:hypothetical protein
MTDPGTVVDKVPFIVRIVGDVGSQRVVVDGPNGGSVIGQGNKLDIDWTLANDVPVGMTLHIEFVEFLAPGEGAPAPVAPIDGEGPVLSGAREYKNKRLKKLGKGEFFFICKYTVKVVGSQAAALDPVIIIEK